MYEKGWIYAQHSGIMALRPESLLGIFEKRVTDPPRTVLLSVKTLQYGKKGEKCLG